MKKRILSILLAVIIVVGMFPVTAMAGKSEKVAKIGDDEYSTLAAAVAAAKSGDTIVLLKDVANVGRVSLPAGVTLDGGGHKLITGDSAIYINKDGGTVKNVFFEGIENSQQTLSAIYAESLTGKLVIDNCRFVKWDWDAIQSTPKAGAEFVITNNYFEKQTNINSRCCVHIQPSSSEKPQIKATITGNTFITSGYVSPLAIWFANYTSTLDLSNNYFDVLHLNIALYDNDKLVTDKCDLAFPCKAAQEDETATVTPTYKRPYDFGVEYYRTLEEAIDADNVALIGNVVYETLADAIAAAPNNTETTITMIDDEVLSAGVEVPATKKIVLDLNGKTISSVKNDAAGSALIKNLGDLTITDNSESKAGKLTTEAIQPDLSGVPGYANNTVTNHGTLKVEGGSIINTSSKGAACYAIDNQNYGGGSQATLTITGGTVTSTGKYAIRMWLLDTKMNTLSITGGTVKSVWVQDDYANRIGSLTIKNATFTGDVKVGYAGLAEHFTLDIQNSTFGGLVQYELDATKEENTIVYKNNVATPFYMKQPSKILDDTTGKFVIKEPVNIGWVLVEDVNAYPTAEGLDIDRGSLYTDTDGNWYQGYVNVEGQIKRFDSYIKDGYKLVKTDEPDTYIITVAPTKVEVKEGSAQVDNADIIDERINNGEIASEAKTNVVENIINIASETSTSNIQEKIPEGTKVEVKNKENPTETDEVTLSESSKTRIDIKLESVQINVSTNVETPAVVADCTVTTKTATYDVKPVVTVTTTDGTGATTAETFVITNDWLKRNNKVLAFTLPVPDSMTGDSVLVTHIKENGEVETFNARVETKNDKRFITINATEFSTYELSQQTEENATAKIENGGKTYYYSSLANAISDAQSGDTITVLKNTDEVVIVERAMNFKLEVATGVNFTGAIRPGDDYVRHIYGDKYYFELYEAGDTIVIGGKKDKDTKTETKEENPETGAPVLSMSTGIVLAGIALVLAKRK